MRWAVTVTLERGNVLLCLSLTLEKVNRGQSPEIDG